jgi:hypothetical protein
MTAPAPDQTAPADRLAHDRLARTPYPRLAEFRDLATPDGPAGVLRNDMVDRLLALG